MHGRIRVGKLLHTGVRIFRYEPGFLHEKVFLDDDEISGVGTANFDNRSGPVGGPRGAIPGVVGRSEAQVAVPRAAPRIGPRGLARSV